MRQLVMQLVSSASPVMLIPIFHASAEDDVPLGAVRRCGCAAPSYPACQRRSQQRPLSLKMARATTGVVLFQQRTHIAPAAPPRRNAPITYVNAGYTSAYTDRATDGAGNKALARSTF